MDNCFLPVRKRKSSRLDWYKANNPSPIYYRNLPSYWENLDKPSLSQQENLALTKDWWTNNDQDHTQINWNSLYNANLNEPVGENGRRAFYFLENDVKNNKIWNVSTHYTNNLTDRMKLVLNLTYQNYYSEQYREIKDLLGADYALNMAKTARGGSFNTLDSNVNKK